ncbi:MAG: bifunctional DNA primase/polymerase, partial [Rhizomicrobium sp.]
MAIAAERMVSSVAPLDAILRLAAKVPVFPCRRNPEEYEVRGEKRTMNAKSPLTGRGLHDASQDPGQISAWWKRWPEALVGVPTGTKTKFVVVDYDAHKADQAGKDWIAEHSDMLLSTRVHSTLNGGRHYLFRTDQEYRNGVCLTLGGVKRGGIDMRAEGGYIIWWPLHGGSIQGEMAPLPSGLVDEQRIEAADLQPLPKNSPAKWAHDRKLLIGALAYLDPGDYSVWSRAGLAIHLASEGADSGFELWHAWSSGMITGDSPANYNGINDCRYHWASYRHDRERSKLVTLGTIFELAKERGYAMPSQRSESPPVEAYADDDRRLSKMLVTRVDPKYDADPDEVLLDVMKLDGAELLDEYRKRHAKYGTTPFDQDGERFRLYPGGVTIWSGYPGSGKTTLLRQLVCHCLARGSSVFVASLEEDPRNVLVGLAAVAAGRYEPTPHQMQWFIDAYGERFRLWGVIGIAQHRKLLAVIRKLASEGIKHAVIDSLMCLDVANDDFEAQRQFANLLAATARASNIHIHLVAHPRKTVNSDQEPDINDVGGAREIGGIADNVLFIRRNPNEKFDPLVPVTPMCIAIRKQRHGTGSLGNIVGWYHRSMRQFNLEQFPSGPVRYLPDDAYLHRGGAAAGQPRSRGGPPGGRV